MVLLCWTCKKFVYFWLCWVFVGLVAERGSFSLVAERGSYSLVVCGFRTQVASLVAEHRLLGSQALEAQ